jgi:LAO/AO transport system kinase
VEPVARDWGKRDGRQSVGRLGRMLSTLENTAEPTEVIDLFPGLPHDVVTIGITGPPGAGKSTLVAALVSLRRRTGRRIGVLAVDPSSRASGGALLGDRIRMQAVSEDSGVFFRSVASRGQLGGLAARLPVMIRALADFGFEEIVIETVGVGQSEIEVRDAVDTTVVVLCPGQGDAVQAAKAGILEIADIYAVNKADLPDAGSVVRDIRAAVLFGAANRAGQWRPGVVSTVARTDDVAELDEQLHRHRAWLGDDGRLAAVRARGVRGELAGLLSEQLLRRIDTIVRDAAFEKLSERIERGDTRRCAGLQAIMGEAGWRTGSMTS